MMIYEGGCPCTRASVRFYSTPVYCMKIEVSRRPVPGMWRLIRVRFTRFTKIHYIVFNKVKPTGFSAQVIR